MLRICLQMTIISMIGRSNMEKDLGGRKLLYAYSFKKCVYMQMCIHATHPSSRWLMGDCHHYLLFLSFVKGKQTHEHNLF